MLTELAPELRRRRAGRRSGRPAAGAADRDPDRRARARAPRVRRHRRPRPATGDRGAARRAQPTCCSSTTRSTSSSPAAPPGCPRAPRSPTATSSTTASSSAAAMRLTERDRLCIPVPLYHCFGMVLGNLACTDARRRHGLSRRGLRPAAVLQTVAAGALHRRSTACRPCSSPSSTTRSSTRFDLSSRCAPASWPARPARSR